MDFTGSKGNSLPPSGAKESCAPHVPTESEVKTPFCAPPAPEGKEPLEPVMGQEAFGTSPEANHDIVMPVRAERLVPFAGLSEETLDAIHISALVDAVLNTRDEEVRLKAIHDLGEYRGKYAEATAKANSKYGPKLNSGPTINALIADEKISKRLSEGLLKCIGADDLSTRSD